MSAGEATSAWQIVRFDDLNKILFIFALIKIFSLYDLNDSFSKLLRIFHQVWFELDDWKIHFCKSLSNLKKIYQQVLDHVLPRVFWKSGLVFEVKFYLLLVKNFTVYLLKGKRKINIFFKFIQKNVARSLWDHLWSLNASLKLFWISMNTFV